MRFNSLAEALPALDRLQQAGSRAAGPITVYQMLNHCAQSVEYSLTGFPDLKPAWFQMTAGALAAKIFLARGAMSHNLADPIPGAPDIPADGDMALAFKRLRDAIARFQAAETAGQPPLRPHFAYGLVTPPSDYDRLQAMHIAQHLGAVT